MPTKEEEKQHTDYGKQECQQRNAAIGKFVMQMLGQPDRLHKVEVKRLWEDHYRVNVLVGVDAASAHVAHSYFLVTDSDGHICCIRAEDYQTVLDYGRADVGHELVVGLPRHRLDDPTEHAVAKVGIREACARSEIWGRSSASDVALINGSSGTE
jgi:hypothetical protein